MEKKKYRIARKKLTCNVTNECETVSLPSPDSVFEINEHEFNIMKEKEEREEKEKEEKERKHKEHQKWLRTQQEIKRKEREEQEIKRKEREELQDAIIIKLSQEKLEKEIIKQEEEENCRKRKFRESLIRETQRGYGFDDSWWSLCI